MRKKNLKTINKIYLSTKPSMFISIEVPGGKSNLLGHILKVGRGGSGGGGTFCKTKYILKCSANKLYYSFMSILFHRSNLFRWMKF